MGWLKASWAVKAPANYFPLTKWAAEVWNSRGPNSQKSSGVLVMLHTGLDGVWLFFM